MSKFRVTVVTTMSYDLDARDKSDARNWGEQLARDNEPGEVMDVQVSHVVEEN